MIFSFTFFIISSPNNSRIATAAPTPTPEKPTIADFWNGNAEFKMYNKLGTNNKNIWQNGVNPALDSWFEAGTRFIDVDGIWYWLGRGTDNSICSTAGGVPGGIPTIKLTIRRSGDKGISWSTPFNPLPSSPTGDCMATDGSLYWDVASGRWALLYQCLGSGTGGKWMGCLAFRNNPDLMGQFTLVQTPVFNGSNIGNTLCSTNYDCGNSGFHPFGIGLNKFIDEGTFDIIGKIGSDFVISAHMFVAGDGNRKDEGIRIIMKSTDWINWRVGDGGNVFPVLDKSNQAGMLEDWTGGAKGFGHGDSLVENGYVYQVSEAVSKTLGCVGNQKWDFTMQRIPVGGISGGAKWEMFGQNPIAYSSDQLLPSIGQTSPCNPAYSGIFKDSNNFTYYHQSRVDEINNGIEIYQLQWKRNILENGSFLRGQMDSWVSNGLTASVTRNHLDSSDNNFALKAVVSNPALNGNVFVANLKNANSNNIGKTFVQTVNVKSTVPMTGMVRLMQADSAGNWLTFIDKNFTSNSNYQEVSQTNIKILPNTAKIYSIVYPIGNGTMFIDQASLEENIPKIINYSCSNPISIMAVGDSNTDGYVTWDGYRPNLWNKMTTVNGYKIDMVGSRNNNNNANNYPNYDGDHESWGANTSYELRSRIINDQSANLSKPDFALLMIGTNDVLKSGSITLSMNGLKDLAKEISRQSPNTTIVIKTIPPTFFADPNAWGGAYNLIPIYNAFLPSVVADLNNIGVASVLVDDLPGNTLGRADLLVDGIHPNESGAFKIADNFYQTLKNTNAFVAQKTACNPVISSSSSSNSSANSINSSSSSSSSSISSISSSSIGQISSSSKSLNSSISSSSSSSLSSSSSKSSNSSSSLVNVGSSSSSSSNSISSSSSSSLSSSKSSISSSSSSQLSPSSYNSSSSIGQISSSSQISISSLSRSSSSAQKTTIGRNIDLILPDYTIAKVSITNPECGGFESLNVFENSKNLIEFSANCSVATIKTIWPDLDPSKNYRFIKIDPKLNKEIQNFPGIVEKEMSNGKMVVYTIHTITDNFLGDFNPDNNGLYDPFGIELISQNINSSNNNSSFSSQSVSSNLNSSLNSVSSFSSSASVSNSVSSSQSSVSSSNSSQSSSKINTTIGRVSEIIFPDFTTARTEITNQECAGFESVKVFDQNLIEFKINCMGATVKTYWESLDPEKNYKFVKVNPITKLTLIDYPAIVGTEVLDGKKVVFTNHYVSDNNLGDFDNIEGKIWDPFGVVQIQNNSSSNSSINSTSNSFSYSNPVSIQSSIQSSNQNLNSSFQQKEIENIKLVRTGGDKIITVLSIVALVSILPLVYIVSNKKLKSN